MRVLIGLAILATLALLAASPALYAFRRTRLGAILTAGGWVMVVIGFALGPHATALVGAPQVQVSKPLVLFLLGWVGLVVGLQADRRLPRVVPGRVMRLALLDSSLSVLAVGAGAAWVMAASGTPWSQLLPAAALLGVCAIGWSPETRSLLRGQGGQESLVGAMRAISGLGAISAVIALGLLITMFQVSADPPAIGVATMGRIVTGLFVTIVLGVTMGLMGMWLMSVAGRDTGQFLVVLLGLVSLTVGASAVMGFSPMFVTLFTGAAVANLPGRSLESFRRVVREAEQPIGMAIMLAAGLLAEPRIGLAGVAIAVAVVAMRVAVKLGVMRGRVFATAQSTAPPPAAVATAPVLRGVMQPNPLAIALAIAYVLSPLGGSPAAPLSGGAVLSIVIITGLAGELWPYLPFVAATAGETSSNRSDAA